MKNIEMNNNIHYKSFINEKIDKDEFHNQIILNKLSLRKKKLYQTLMEKRKFNIIKNEDINIDKSNQLSQVSILIHKEDFDNIQSGLNIFYDYLINNEKLDKENIKYIFENIYYRLLDILNSDKNYDNNKHMNKILFLIRYLTTENNIFIGPITEQLFLISLKAIIEINIKNINFLNLIIPLLSDILTNKKRFVQIMNELDIIKIMKIKIEENNNDKDNIEQLLLLMNNFIMNINKDSTHKFKFILEYILNFLNNNVFINDNDSLIMITIFDILIYMANNQSNLKIIKNSNCINFIKNIINANKNIIQNLYLLKCYELLSNIIMNTDNSDSKKVIINFIYNNSKNNIINIQNDLPFIKELNESIKIKNKSFIYILINCIISLINNNEFFSELYCFNNNFINELIILFTSKTSKKIKNEIIIFFINIIENNNIKIYKYLLNTEIFSIFISYIKNKIKSKNESSKIIIYNILFFINICLLIDKENNINIIINFLGKYKFKEIVELLIENKDESISDISRSIFIKYFSSPENIYCNNSINNDKDQMIID